MESRLGNKGEALSKSVFHTTKCRCNYPGQSFFNKDEAYVWIGVFVGIGIKFVTPTSVTAVKCLRSVASGVPITNKSDSGSMTGVTIDAELVSTEVHQIKPASPKIYAMPTMFAMTALWAARASLPTGSTLSFALDEQVFVGRNDKISIKMHIGQ